jgi:penicillin amidase
VGVRKTLGRVALGGLMIGAIGAAVVAYALRRPVPKTKGRLRLAGLRADVEIVRDQWGVPHIYAGNLHDLFFACGYAQAQDRLWQMDFNRRAATGTLAELVGEPALEIDRLVRRVGFHRAAARDWETATDEERATLQAFAAGVNAYIESGRLPLEFQVLRRKPRRWEPTDTLAFGRFLGWSLAGNWDSELVRSWTIGRFGAAVMAEFEPTYPEGGPVIVPPGAEAKGPRPDVLRDFTQAEELIGLVGQAMSNNWAVDGTKSATGKPLLASDPHLPLTMPSIWWEAHLDSPEIKAAGVGVPSLPGIFLGHNENIAWGMTAAMVDGDDLFVEEINPDNPSQYRYKDGWEQGEIVREEIIVRGRKEPVIEEVLVTRHGPVVSPAIEGEERDLSLRTVANEPARQTQAYLDLMAARDWNEFRSALSQWPFPPLNFGYADVEGNIGYQLAGLAPKRADGLGIVPMPGWTGEYDWTGFLPFEEHPHAFNPPTHWVASANNQIADDDFPHFLAVNFADPYRQQRIIEMLGETDKHSADDFERMQVDQQSIPARELAPLMLQLEPRDEWCRRALTFVKAWDYELSTESVAACVYEMFYVHLVRRALEEKLGGWSEYFLGRGVHPLRAHGGFFNLAHSWLMEKMRERPDWFAGRTWHEVMEEALESAVSELREMLGDEVSRWQWGRLHRQSFRHPLGEVRGLDVVFNRPSVPVGGDANTVWQAAYAPHHGYDLNSFTASWRQIIDLADFNNSRAVLPSGNSGHPGSAHYHSMNAMWRSGGYHPMLWDRAEVEKVAAGTLVLEA